MSKQKPCVYIGTIGHCEHGKTTLTAVLASVCSQSSEGVEMKYDITALPERMGPVMVPAANATYYSRMRQYSHVDIHGSELARAVIAGAWAVDGAILVVCIIPASSEHRD